MTPKIALLSALSFSLSSQMLLAPSVAAQTDAGDNDGIDTIIVTGTRFETPIDQIGRSVSVLTVDDIETRQQRFIFDALNAVPGVQVIRSGSFGGLSSVSLRGLPSDQTLVVQDGIVSNNPAFFGNTFDFANFDAADVERIEVLRGAQSTLYGSDAIGGIVNIITKDGREGFGGTAFVEGGSFGTVRGAATLLGGSERASARVTIAGVNTQGFSAADEADGNSEDDGFRNITISSKARARPVQSLELEGVFRYSDSANEFDGFAPPTFIFGDSDDSGDTRDLSLAGSATHTLFGGRLENRFRVTYYDSAILNEGGGFVTFDAQGDRLSYEYQGTARPVDAISIIGGFEFERERAETNATPGVLSVSTTTFFGLVQLRPTDYITLDGGFRVDNNSAFGSETTFTGSASVRVPGTGLTLRGSYAEGFQAPTSGELNFNLSQADSFIFDPSIDLFLDPESSTGFDLGLDYTLLDGRVLLQATYFNQDVDDLVTFLFVPGAPNFGVFSNIEEFDTEGVEVALGAQLTPRLRFNAAYTYVDATNVTANTTAGNQPDHRFNLELAAQPTDRLTLSVGVNYNGAEIDGFNTLDAFTLVSVRGQYELKDTFEIFARLENATNADYQDNFGFGTAPISAFGGLRARF